MENAGSCQECNAPVKKSKKKSKGNNLMPRQKESDYWMFTLK